tara:strand:+ start:1631 stop:3844 length:2214 start_codon:yes stop_codon:yes gene_type:complete
MNTRIQWLVILIFQTLCFAYNPDYVITADAAIIEPIIDGHIINDPAWQSLPEVNTFIQKSPDEGEAVTEKTVVKVMYSTEVLYIAAVCYDDSPEKIVIVDTRRDAPLNNTDSFMFILDTFQDQQNGYVFGTNAGGIEYDAQVSKGGEGMSISTRRQSVGTGDAYNINWDAVWKVQTNIGDYGWSAEFAIPFKTLRYAKENEQEWGINFQRVIAHKHEQVFWAPIPRQYSLNRLMNAGTITGIKVPNVRTLKIMPYTLGSKNSVYSETEYSSTASDFGLDAKFGVTSSLILDLTYNTDFAQVEADEQQINLDRFSLFFPEKRGFFLENAGLFSIGENTFSGPDIEMFFSRRIGISPNGEPLPIVGGGRLTGTAGGFRIGALNMQTKAVNNVTDGDNYSVLRIKKELPNRTSYGVIMTNRTGLGTDGNLNNSYAIDASLGVGEAIQFIGFAAKSDPDQDIQNGDTGTYAYLLESNRNTKTLTTQLRFTEVGDNFNPEIGYVKRQGYRKILFRILNRTRPKDTFGLLEIRPHISFWGYWKLDGFLETSRLHVDNHWEFRNGYRIDTAINFLNEGVVDTFEIAAGVMVPSGRYDHKEIQIRSNTNLTKPFNIIMVNKIGGFFGGYRQNVDLTIGNRFGNRFTSEIISKYNDVHLPGGNFITHLIRTRLTYAFSPKIYIQFLIQYNNQSDEWSINSRFIWQKSAATGLYLVFNQTQDYDGIPIDYKTTSMVFKYSYLFDVYK